MGGFAVYRLPYAKQATLVRQTEGEPLELSSCQALNGQQGFVIAPFEITPAQPIVLIRPDETEVVDLVFSRKEEGGMRKENSLEAGGNLLPRSSFLLPRKRILAPRQVEALRFIWANQYDRLGGGDLEGCDDKALLTVQSLTAGQFQRFSLSLTNKGSLLRIR